MRTRIDQSLLFQLLEDIRPVFLTKEFNTNDGFATSKLSGPCGYARHNFEYTLDRPARDVGPRPDGGQRWSEDQGQGEDR